MIVSQYTSNLFWLLVSSSLYLLFVSFPHLYFQLYCYYLHVSLFTKPPGLFSIPSCLMLHMLYVEVIIINTSKQSPNLDLGWQRLGCLHLTSLYPMELGYLKQVLLLFPFYASVLAKMSTMNMMKVIRNPQFNLRPHKAFSIHTSYFFIHNHNHNHMRQTGFVILPCLL